MELDNAKQEAIRSYIIDEIIRGGAKPITYSKLNDVLDLGLEIVGNHGHGMNELVRFLDNINDQELKSVPSRWPLSVFVVNDQTHVPGTGFYKKIEPLYEKEFGKLSHEGLFKALCAKCNDFWRNNDNYQLFKNG